MKLDELLSAPDPSAEQASDRMRAALLAELDLPPARTWRGDVLAVFGGCTLVFFAAAAALVVSGSVKPDQLIARAVPIGALLALGAVCTFAALAPRRRGALAGGFALALVGMVGLVLARHTSTPGTAPAWVCTLSHLAVAAAPLVFGLWLLRKSAIDPLRAGLLGLAVGTTGAMLGELACEQGASHVAVWHLGPWLLLGLIAAIASSRIIPRSFAP